MMNMQEHVQIDIQQNMEAQVTIAVRAAMAWVPSLTPQQPSYGFCSTQMYLDIIYITIFMF